MKSEAADSKSAREPPLPPTLDPSDAPPLDQFCDLVLKGGVVDGVIYPGVLIELARRYRFQSLAGTSVGAIAAGLAAACEYSRRFGSNSGFDDVLRKVPDELAKESAQQPGNTVIRSLFQTSPKLERLFGVVVDTLSVPGPELAKELFQSLWRHYWEVLVTWFLIGAALAVALICIGFAGIKDTWDCLLNLCPVNASAFEAVLKKLGLLIRTPSHWIAVLAAALAASLYFFWRTIKREVLILTGQPGFGFCSGLSVDGGKTEALIDWLHRGLQGAAGLRLNRPLTFQDLWDAPNGPKNADGSVQIKSIDLRMMTTCVSHGRPYELPLSDTSTRLFFCLKEWKHYFPESVIAHLEEIARRYKDCEPDVSPGAMVGNIRKPDLRNSPHPEDVPPDLDLRELPFGDLPVLVAIRLSMNFPILFQAVPMWAIDHEAGRIETRPRAAAPRFKKAWFADGGVTSNFPLHIFDQPIPSWPTFGVFINKVSRKKGYNGDLKVETDGSPLRTHLTLYHTSGRSEKWYEIDETASGTRKLPFRPSGFFDFLLGMGVAAKDWADNANLRMPGIRDRVVTVFQNGLTRGGLNLKIEGEQIRKLAYINGTEAGTKLAGKFYDAPPRFNENLVGSAAWLDHRWVRFNSYLNALKANLEGISASANMVAGSSPLRAQIAAAVNKEPLYFNDCFEPKLSPAQSKAMTKALAAIEQLETELSDYRIKQPYMPKPQPELKTTFRL
jgi:predicted acylesterase/phospholipase RssA